jgi:nucleoside 2-deoxyribosyltransferase
VAFQTCFICNSQLDGDAFGQLVTGIRVNCKVCKPYTISERCLRALHPGKAHESHLISGAVRELNDRGVNVVINNFDDVLASVVVPNGPLERIDRIVRYIYEHMDSYDSTVKLIAQLDYSIAYAKHAREFGFLIDRASELRYMDRNNNGDEYTCQLTIAGWKHVSDLIRHDVKTNQAFVAMSFDETLRSIYFDAIKPAIEQSGYAPIRVDEAQYNEKIDDRIIADIRKSGLVIADFTQHKAGVYFEAGFALGLGIPVIWICRETDIESTHFDTRQYNHIVWKDAQDLKEKLVARIEATVPLTTARLKAQQ